MTLPGDDAADWSLPAPESVLERVAGQRVRLQAVANALAQALDPRAVATEVLDAACAVLQAPQGWVVGVTDDGVAVEMLAAVGFKRDLVEPWMRVPMDTPVPMTDVIRTGRPVYHATADERRTAYPALAVPHYGIPVTEGSAVIPLVFEGRSTGALAISFPGERAFDEDDRWFLETLAAQGAQALERARLFAQVQERDARLRFTLEATGTGTWEWDLVADRLTWSPEALRIHGLDEPPPGIGAWLEGIAREDRAAVRAKVRECLRTGERFDVEYRVVRPDASERWAHSVGRMVRGGDGHPVRMLGTIRDVTDRRLAEAERDRMIEAEREAARLRDAFIGVVSHELRTPITTIFGGTRVLARRWPEMEAAQRDTLLADIVEEADRLYRLVEDLLVLTRVERGTLEAGDEPIHLGWILERVLASERPRWPGVAFVLDVPPGLPSAAGEDTFLEQVLRNLLGNAAKYGGPGSTVRIVAGAEDAHLVLRVLDEGPGIDEAEADRLFDLFYRSPATAARVSGAGIGLFVCRQLVEAMGGSIRAERRPEGGAAFVVRLPLHHDDGEP